MSGSQLYNLVSTPMKGLLTTAIIWLCVAGSVFAQSSKEEAQLIEQASTWFEEEHFAQAYPIYSQLVSLHPQDADLNFRFGTCALYAGVEKEKAVKHIGFGIKKGCSDPRAHYYLAKAYHLNYNFALAEKEYNLYLNLVSSKEKNPLPAALNIEMCQQGAQLLSNIRDVVVLEKTGASYSDFYRYYDLEEIGGKVISTPEELLSKYDKKADLVSVMHFPGNAITIYFTSYGKDNSNGKDIYKADLLPGGEFSAPEPLSASINTKFDEDFAFMHPDGKTFYFASKGHNSMGGYDIFKAEFNKYTGDFGTPVNLDFAINTPDDDIFYVVDSLKKTAYFASGRSSAQDEVHVYKVMVKSLPVNLTFIAGTYIPEADGVANKANIKIVDELTGMPILETIASIGDEGYLLDLPKGGMYRIDVQAQGSQIVHSGAFDVPFSNESTAWAQELRIVKEDGQEKLIITNYFESALDVSIAQLSAEVLRSKAGLAPNASDEILQQLEQEDDLRDDITKDQLTAIAGFSANVTIESIQEELKYSSVQDQKMAARLQAHSGMLLEDSKGMNATASVQLTEAEELMTDVDKTDNQSYAQTLIAYQELIMSAVENKRNAQNALEASKMLNAESRSLLAKSEQSANSITQLETALSSEDMNAALEILETAYNNKKKTGVELAVIEETLSLADEKEQDEEVQLNALVNLRSQEDDLQKKILQTEKELEATTKKSLRNQLMADLEALRIELITAEFDIDRKVIQTNELGTAEQNLRAQVDLFRNAASTVPASPNEKFDSVLAAELASELSTTENKIAILTIDDPEAMAILDEEKRATRNDIEILQGIRAQALAIDLELKPVVGLRKSYSSNLEGIIKSSISPSEQTRALISSELAQVERQIEFMRKMNVNLLSTEESAQRAKELQLAMEWRNELQNEAKNIDNTYTSLTEDEKEKRAQELFSEEFEVLNRNSVAGEELETTDSKLTAALQLEINAQSRIQENNQAIIKSDDAAEVASLTEENRRLNSIIEWSENQTDMNELKLSYENDQREVIDSNLSFLDKTENQVRLTEKYIEMLENLEEGRGHKMAANELRELNTNIIQSQNKLDSYNSDLELALSTEEEPAEIAINIVEAPPVLPTTVVELNALVANDATPEDRIQFANDEIQKRTTAIDLLADEAEKERMQMEISLLNQFSTEASNEIELNLAETNALPKEEVVMAPVSSEEGSRLDEIALTLAPVEMVDLRKVSEHPQMQVLEERMNDYEDYDKATEKIDISTSKINELQSELVLSKKKGQMKKLDKAIEDQYFDKADAEVKRSILLSNEAQLAFEENKALIFEAKEKMSTENDLIRNHVEDQEAQANDLMEQASRIREQAAPEIDDIKQAHEFNQATALEFEALAMQDRSKSIIDEEERLSQLDEELLTNMLKGRYDSTLAPVALSETAEKPEVSTLETPEVITTTTAEIEIEPEEEDKTAIATTSGLIEAQKQLITAEITSIAAPYVNIENTAPKTAEFVIRSARIREANPLDNEWLEVYDLNEEEVASVRRNAAYVKYVKAREELKVLEAKHISSVEARNAKAAELNATLDRISLIEQAIMSAANDAERDGLIEELKTLYRQAEVQNKVLKEEDQSISELASDLNNTVTDLEQLFVMLDVAEIIAETRTNAAAAAAAEAAAEAEAEAAVVETVPEAVVAPVLSEVSPEVVALAPIAESTVTPGDIMQGGFMQYLFAYPRVLTGSLFGITDEAIYSVEQPIPLNPLMPEGVVYKVQVGAFRNAIPQDHFGEFAPLAGEELNNGITRYTAGLFVAYNAADGAKEQIRAIGYQDAFVVAFRNGKRISLAEAREAGEEEDLLASKGETAIPTETGVVAETSSNPVASEVNITPPAAATSAPPIPAFASNWKTQIGVYYTVQIGVYSREVTATDLSNTPQIYADQTTNGFIRYTSGKFTNAGQAEARKNEARTLGVTDAFVSAYQNGKRISLSKAKSLSTSNNTVVSEQGAQFQLKIGSYTDQVPSSVARALLMLEAKWGIYQVKEGTKTVYYSREFASETEAERAKRDFQDFEVQIEEFMVK